MFIRWQEESPALRKRTPSLVGLSRRIALDRPEQFPFDARSLLFIRSFRSGHCSKGIFLLETDKSGSFVLLARTVLKEKSGLLTAEAI